MKKIVFTSLFSILGLFVIAQEYTISGYLKDSGSGEELLYATVSVEGTSNGVNTNLYGFYSLSLPAGKYGILFSYIGYETQKLEIDLREDKEIDVELISSSNTLDEVVVLGEREDDNVTNTEVSVVTIDVQKTKKIPVLLGEQNILKTFQLMPGVSSNSEGGSGFFVRGGKADQNLILLDEAPVYNASHLLGFFSVFNSDALKDVKLYKGGIPAQYGGRASSVMDIRMKNGNMKKWEASGGVGLISSRLTVEGPIVEDKGSIIVSGRRTYADLVAQAVSDQFDGVSLYFYDLNLKANYKIGSNDRLFFSGYLGRDAFGFDAFGFDWGNQTYTTRWNHTFNNKLFSNTSLIYSQYDYGFDIEAGETQINLSAGIFDYNLKQDYNYYLNPNNSISFGWQTNLHQFQPSVFSFSDIEDEGPGEEVNYQNALESGIYASNEQKLGSRTTVNYGLRLSIFNNVGAYTESLFDEEDDVIGENVYGDLEFYNTYVGLEPRISATYLLDKNSSLKASYNRNNQYLHLLSNSNAGTPTDVWIPSSPQVKPITADQVAVGYFRNFSNNQYKLTTEAYYKYLQNIVDYEDGAEIFGNNNLESELVFGEGRSYGIEVMVEKTKGKLTGWVGYTLSKAISRSEDVNNGDWYSARQDRTHDLSIVAIYEIHPKWTLSASWVYYTGDAVTFPSGKYFIEGQLVNLYTERNGDRMPDYHRMDLGLTWTIKDSPKFYSDLNFSVYNAYNRKNAYSINFSQNEAGQTEATRLALFGAVPAITWNFKF